MTTQVETRMCPYCPLFLDDPEMWYPVENESFGEPARIGNERSCEGCAIAAGGHEEELLADLYKWRAQNGGTELNSFFGALAWFLDFALERLAEHFGSLVELFSYLETVDRSVMVLVSNAADSGVIVDIGRYVVWVEQGRDGWSGTLVVDTEEYGIGQEVQA